PGAAARRLPRAPGDRPGVRRPHRPGAPDARQAEPHRAWRRRPVSRPAQSLHRHPLPFPDRRARLAAGRPRDHRGERGRADHGPRAPPAAAVRRAVPPGEHRLRAGRGADDQLPVDRRGLPAAAAGHGMTAALEDLKRLLGIAAQATPLTEEQAELAFDAMMSGNVTPAQMGGFLMALRVRGETVAEITGAVRAMRGKMLRIKAPA